MSWNFDLKVDGFDFMYTRLDGIKGVVVAPETDLKDKKYLKALAKALSYYDYVETFMDVYETKRYWYNGDEYSREQINTEALTVKIKMLLAQKSLTMPDWLPTFLEDIRNNHPAPFKYESLKKKQDTKGFVYLLKSSEGHYKIGKSKDPENRAKTFGVQLPFRVEYVCLIQAENMRQLELSLHQKYEAKRINGEWFDLAPEDVEYIRGLAT